MQEAALAGLKSLGAAVVPFAARIDDVIRSGRNVAVSPLVADCLYAAAKQYLWYARETGSAEVVGFANDLMGTLTSLGGKWEVASKGLTPCCGDRVLTFTQTVMWQSSAVASSSSQRMLALEPCNTVSSRRYCSGTKVTQLQPS